MLTLQIILSAAIILATPPAVWYAMQWWHDRTHGKREPVAVTHANELTVAVDSALASVAKRIEAIEGRHAR